MTRTDDAASPSLASWASTAAGTSGPGAEPSVDELILGLIRERGFRAGDRLPTEAEFAQGLSLPRQKVREGFLSLESQGVVRSRQGSGRVLLDRRHHTLPALLGPGIGHSVSALLDAVAVRQVLEVGFLPAAIDVVDDEALEAMGLAVENMTRCAERGAFIAADDRAFHSALFSKLENHLLASLLDKFWDLLETVDLDHLRHREAITETVGHHARILDAVRRRDPEAAQLHMSLHFYDSVESLRDLAEAGPAASARLGSGRS